MDPDDSTRDEERILVPRAYQLEILEVAKVRNTLAFLPTASGKTLISLLLIKHRLTEARKANGPKRSIAFLAPTRLLVSQQRKYIEANFGGAIVVREYVGETSRNGRKISDWNAEKWQIEVQQTDVMVFIPQVIKAMLQGAFLPISAFDLFVLDECHHAFKQDPMAVVCALIKASAWQPLVLGLTASPLPCKKGLISAKISMLEDITGCKLICPKDSIQDLRSHVSIPNLALLRHGYMCDRNSRGGEIPFNGSSALLLPEVANKVFYDMKNKPIWSVSQSFLSVRDNGHAVISHALLRVIQADNVSALHKLLSTMQMQPTELEAKCHLGTLLPPAGPLPNQLSGSSLLDIQQIVGQIQRIVLDSGVLCGVWAMAISMDAKRVESEVGRSASSCINNSNFDVNKDKSTRVSSVSVSTVDFEKYQVLVDRLRDSPFRIVDLLRGQQVACSSLLDILAALVMPLGPCVCQRAVDKLLSKSPPSGNIISIPPVSLPSRSSSSTSSTDSSTSHSPNRQIIGSGSGRKDSAQESADQIVICVMQACAERCSQSDHSIDHGSLCFLAGSDGVTTSFISKCNSSQPLILDCIKLSICDCCIALLGAITHDELQIALSLPLSSANVGGGRKIVTLDDSLITEPKVVMDVEKFSIEASLREMYKESSHTQGAERDTGLRSFLDQPSALVTSKVVALFHFWKEIGKQKQNGTGQGDGKALVEGSMDGNVSNTLGPSSSSSRLRSDYIGLIASELADNWAAIVFCKMRLTAMALCRLLDMFHRSSITQSIHMGVASRMTHLTDTSNDSPAPLKGRCLVGQSKPNEQMEMLRLFDAGDFNLLFATDVAEEGLDLRSCQLVINFDSPDTVKSFIQRRGRARSNNSYVVSVVPFGVQGVGYLKDLAAFCGQEQDMLQHGNELISEVPSSSLCTLVDILRLGCQVEHREIGNPSLNCPANFTAPVPLTAAVIMVSAAVPDPTNHVMEAVCTASKERDGDNMGYVSEMDQDRDQDREEEHLMSYVSPSGAIVDRISAQHLLTQYCNQLPHDIFYVPEQILWITKHAAPLPVTQEFSCSILLPSSVPPHLRCLVGPKMPTKSAARNVACLLCVRALHIDGEINDWFYAADGKFNDKNEEEVKVSVDVTLGQKEDKEKDKKPLSEGDLVDLDIKTVPDYLTVPSAAVVVSPHTSPRYMIDLTGEFPNQIEIKEIRRESASTDTVLHMYSVTASCIDYETEKIVSRCNSCIQYLKGLNRVGFSLLSPLSADVLNTPISMTLREREDLISQIVYLGPKSVSNDDLKQMQRFHQGILCWEAERDFTKRTDSRAGRFIKSVPCSFISSESSIPCGPMGHDVWAESGGGAWYCLFPLPDDMASLTLHNTRNKRSGGYSRNSSPGRSSSASSSRRNSYSAPSSPSTDSTLSEIFSNAKLWSQFLFQSADEAQVLAHNLRMQKEINESSSKDMENVFGDPLTRCSGTVVSNMCNKIVTKGRGGLFLTADTTTSGSHLNDVLKMVSESDIPTYKGYSRADHVSSAYCQCGCANSKNPQKVDLEEGEVAEIAVADRRGMRNGGTVPVTFRDHMCSKYTDAIPFINGLYHDPTHYLLSMVPITNMLTLCPLLGSLKTQNSADMLLRDRTKAAAKTDKTFWNCMQGTATPRGRQENSNYRCNGDGRCTNTNCSNYGCSSSRKGDPTGGHKPHTHSKSIMVVPEFCRVVGEAKWFFCGLVAPSVVWRMQSLVLAEEARAAIVTLIDAPRATDRSQVESKTERGEVTGLAMMMGMVSSLPVILPSPSIMLEALTPRMAGERLNSERLEHLGDCLLKLVTTVELYRIYPCKYEGFLTTMRSKTISNFHLYSMARAHGLAKYLRAAALSNGKQTLMFSPTGISPRRKRTPNLSCWNINLTPPPDVAANIQDQAKTLPPISATTSASLQSVHVSDEPSSNPAITAWFVPKSKRKRLKTDSPESSVDSEACGVLEKIVGNTSVSRDVGTNGSLLTSGAPPGRSNKSTTTISSPAGTSGSDDDSCVDSRDGSDSGAEDIGSRKKARRKRASLSAFVGVRSTTIKVKALADFMEALIGAFYVHGGLRGAVAVIRAIGAWPEMPKQARNKSFAREASSNNGDVAFPTPDNRLANIPRGYPDELRRLAHGDADNKVGAQREISSRDEDGSGGITTYKPTSPIAFDSYHDGNKFSANISIVSDSIHRKIGYLFKNNSLLSLALTHCSVQHALSNQRLEFLGDAVLDFVVVKQLHRSFGGQDDGPGEISIRKNELTNNRSLGIIALKLRLFEELNVNAVNLSKEFIQVGKILSGKDFFVNADSVGSRSRNNFAAACCSSGSSNVVKYSDGRLFAPVECPEIEEALKHVSTVNALADVVEALIGAVYLDSDGCLETVLTVVRSIGMDL